MILKLLILVLTVYYIWVFWKYYRQDITGLFERTEKYGTEKEPEQPGDAARTPGLHRDNRFHALRAGKAADFSDMAKAGLLHDQPGHAGQTGLWRALLCLAAKWRTNIHEPEEDEEEEYVPTPEEVRELEEEEELGAYYSDGNPDFATGYSFEDLKKVHRVLVSDDADEKAEREAREVLPSVMGSDIWEPMLDAFEGARQRVARLMKNHNV